MQVEGGCFCGQVRYQAEVQPQLTGVCHCRDCQITGGSAFRLVAVVAPASFSYTKGTPKNYDKVADSGAVRTFQFCENCGTHLCSQPADAGAPGSFVSVRLATSDQFDQFSPAVELFCSSRVAWLPELPGATARFDKMPIL